jgi:membrane associated rhomboid family serine protease
VNQISSENADCPVWARADAFPEAPPGWGWLDTKSKPHPCDSLEALSAAVRDDPDGSLTLAWTPEHPQMVLPEELAGMGDALRDARSRWTRDDLENATRKLRSFGIALACCCAYVFYNGFDWYGKLAAKAGITVDLSLRLPFAFKTLLGSTTAGLGLLGFLIFAFIPWYQARKRSQELGKWTEAGIEEATPTIRFETWLDRQQAPVTKIILGLIALVGLAQLLPSDALAAAGLLKNQYHHGEWWRLLTAPFLHGNVVHFLMNAAGLLYLGKRLEVFARWPHLPLVFLFAACVGGETSARFVTAPSVGASGGLMGWLGFLLVFETLHRSLVPRSARRRLAAGVALTALIGLIGYRYIDNAAHAGGLVAGMLYAAIVFPASSSPHRPRSNAADRLAGITALVVLVTAAAFASYKIIAS